MEWISVEDGLPNDYAEVWVYANWGDYSNFQGHQTWYAKTEGGFQTTKKVTHWMYFYPPKTE